jgi:hypothetical protein
MMLPRSLSAADSEALRSRYKLVRRDTMADVLGADPVVPTSRMGFDCCATPAASARNSTSGRMGSGLLSDKRYN